MPKQLTALSLGAGVQSTALLLLAVEGRIPMPEVAVFADTGWEPKGVYDHLDRLEREVAQPAGIEIVRARATRQSGQGLRADALWPVNRFFSFPAFMRRDADDAGARPVILRRSCTEAYKLSPVYREFRRRLGANVSASGAVGPVPVGATVTNQIGISADEFQRARDSGSPWITNSYPLLDIGWSRERCLKYLADAGWDSVQKSACIGCPFHSDSEWRRIRDTDPESWADAVDFDKAIRNGPPRERRDGTRWPATYYLHPSGLPLDEVRLREPRGVQLDLLDTLEETSWSCSPFGCKTDNSEFQDSLRAAGAVEVNNVSDCDECGAGPDDDCYDGCPSRGRT